MNTEQLEEKAKSTKKNYVKDDGIVYVKLSDGRLWCPSLQARGTRYDMTEPSLMSLQDNYVKTQDFVAIDFETALMNSNPCQIGITVVRNGVIDETFSLYIKPKDNKYSAKTIKCHHITPQMTENEDEFPVVWDIIKQYFNYEYIVAHNGSYDIKVLEKTLDDYDIEYPEIRKWICTCDLTNRMKLNVACDKYGIEFSEDAHHDAKYDSEACARLYLALINGAPVAKDFDEEQSKAKYEELEKKNRANFHLFGDKTILSKIFPNQDLSIAKDKNNPFYNKDLVVTGDFSLFNGSRYDLGKVLHEMGAGFKSSPSRKVHFLLVGNNPGLSKIAKAEEINKKGGNIKIIKEEELRDILDGKNWQKYVMSQNLLF